jgi:hypothetical protein
MTHADHHGDGGVGTFLDGEGQQNGSSRSWPVKIFGAWRVRSLDSAKGKRAFAPPASRLPTHKSLSAEFTRRSQQLPIGDYRPTSSATRQARGDKIKPPHINIGEEKLKSIREA